MSKKPPIAPKPKPGATNPGKAKKPDPPDRQAGDKASGIQLRSRGPGFADDPPPSDRAFVTGHRRIATVQAKPKVGRNGDHFEDEANRVADDFVANENKPGPLIARKPAGISYGVLPSRTSVRAKGGDPGGGEVDDDTHSVIESSRGKGESMPEPVQSKMEGHLGADLSSVRVHQGADADRATKNIGAKAFTTGSDVYFGAGQYKPGSTEGKHLLAHELTHVVQQGAAKPLNSGRGTGLMAKADPAAKPEVSERVQSKRIQRASLADLTGDTIAGKVDGFANFLPGWRLIKFALGNNPITGKKIKRSGAAFLAALLGSLGPAGNLLLRRLRRVKAIQRTANWIQSRIRKFNLNTQRVIRLAKTAWDKVTLFSTNATKKKVIKQVFAPLFRDLKKFTRAAAAKSREIIFKGFMRLVGGNKGPIGRLIKKARPVIRNIWNNPVRFAKNVFRGIKIGVQGFLKRIGKHLKKGFMEWLFGTVGRAGIIFPEKLDFKGVTSLVLQLTGFTYANFRERAIKKFGQKTVAGAETTLEIFKKLKSEGPMAIIDKVQEQAAAIKQQVIAGIQKIVIIQAIKAGILWIIGLLNPASAIVKVLKALVDVTFFVIQRAKQLIEFGNALLNSVTAIAKGNVSLIARRVESAFARGIPVAIGLLANVAGLGGLASKIQAPIKAAQAPAKKAIDAVLNKIRGLFGKGKGKGRGKGKGKGKDKGKGGKLDLKKLRAEFKMSGAPHTLSVKKNGRKVKIIMASENPGQLSTKLAAALAQLEATKDQYPGGVKFIKQRLEKFKSIGTSLEGKVATAFSERPKKSTRTSKKRQLKTVNRLVQDLQRLAVLIAKFGTRMQLKKLGLTDLKSMVDKIPAALPSRKRGMLEEHDDALKRMARKLKWFIIVRNSNAAGYKLLKEQALALAKPSTLHMKTLKMKHLRELKPGGVKETDKRDLGKAAFPPPPFSGTISFIRSLRELKEPKGLWKKVLEARRKGGRKTALRANDVYRIVRKYLRREHGFVVMGKKENYVIKQFGLKDVVFRGKELRALDKKDVKAVAFTSDYDLHGVYKRRGKGGGAAKQVEVTKNQQMRFNQIFKRLSGIPKDVVMHGAQDKWPFKRNLGIDPHSTAYQVDGQTKGFRNRREMGAFYMFHFKIDLFGQYKHRTKGG